MPFISWQSRIFNFRARISNHFQDCSRTDIHTQISGKTTRNKQRRRSVCSSGKRWRERIIYVFARFCGGSTQFCSTHRGDGSIAPPLFYQSVRFRVNYGLKSRRPSPAFASLHPPSPSHFIKRCYGPSTLREIAWSAGKHQLPALIGIIAYPIIILDISYYLMYNFVYSGCQRLQIYFVIIVCYGV